MGLPNWSPEMKERLRELHQQGKSDRVMAKIMAEEFDRPTITRSAIIGARHRNGLYDDVRTMIPKRGGSKKNRIKRTREASAATREAVRKIERMSVPSLFKGNEKGVTNFSLNVPDLKCEKVALIELTDDVCKWPLDDGLYCGNGRDKVVERLPYCPWHASLAIRRTPT